MAYCTQAQALSYCGRLNAGSALSQAGASPSLSDLNTFINDRSEQIDAALKARGLSTPITAPAEFVAELAALNARAAAADMMVASYLTNDGNDRGTGAIWLKDFTDRLNQIRQGIGVPVTVAAAEQDLAVHSLWTDSGATTSDGVNQFGERVPARPIFSIGRRF